jgi:hypothetical protein
MNRFENFGWLWIAVSITDFVMAVIRQSVIALVDDVRSGWSFKQPSPKNCPSSSWCRLRFLHGASL